MMEVEVILGRIVAVEESVVGRGEREVRRSL
jgi:hypothetical protein